MKQLIKSVENKILNNLNGTKLDISHFYANLEIYFNGNIEDFRRISPSCLQEIWTEIHIPDDFFYAFYHIPTNKSIDYNIYYTNSKSLIPKEFIVCIGSSDKTSVDYITLIIPPYVKIEQADKIAELLSEV